MTRHSDDVYLRHMRDHTAEAMEMLGEIPRDQLASRRTVQLAILHLVGIVGEAANRVSAGTRSKIPKVPWRDIIGMRNPIIHGYDTIDTAMLWDTVKEDLPLLAAALNDCLDGADPRS